MEPKIRMSILAKMARDIRSVTQEEASEIVTNAVRLCDAYYDLQAQLILIKNRADIAEQEVKFLSVESK